MNMLRSLAIVCTLGAAAACGSDDPPTMAGMDCAAGSAPRYTDVAAFDKCTMCHSSSLKDAARNHAPPQINFDTYEAADAAGMEAVQQVATGRMPPSPSGITLTEAEKEQLTLWVDCGSLP